MKTRFAAAAFAAIAAGAFASAAMAEGPKVSSETFIPGMQAGAAVSSYDAAMQGPKVSSETHIAPTRAVAVAAVQPPTTAQRYVWQEGYDPHGKWRGHWLLSR